MLAGTLVTIAGFVPVGFAASSAGEYTFSLFAVVGIALIVSWFVAVIFAPLLGVAILTPPKAAQTAEPGRVFRWYRGFLTAGHAGAMGDDRVHAGAFRRRPFSRFRSIPRQFFPSSDRPELLVDLSLPQNASIYASETAAQRFDAAPEGRSGRRALEHLCRPRRHPLLSAAQRPAAERLLRPGGDRRQGRRGARAAATPSWRRCWPRSFRARSRASIRSSSGRRSAGRCSTASAAPTSSRCARSRSSSPRSWQPIPSAEKVNFDWIEPARAGAHPHRPGSGAAARPELAGPGRASSTP